MDGLSLRVYTSLNFYFFGLIIKLLAAYAATHFGLILKMQFHINTTKQIHLFFLN